MKEALSRIISNKHTSLAALVVVLCNAGEIVLPQYKQRLDDLEKWVLGYGFLMAGDSAKKKKGEAAIKNESESKK